MLATVPVPTPQPNAEQIAALKAQLDRLSPAALKELSRPLLQKELELCARDGWHWVRQHVKTRDEAAGADESVKAFPAEPALKAVWDVLQYGKSKLIVIAKSRQIMASWEVCAFALHHGRFFDNRQVVWQTKREDDAKDMVCYGNDRLDEARIQFMEKRLPPWMRERTRFRDGQMIWGNGSKIVAVPEGGNQVRSKTTSLVIMDEAAYQEQFRAAWTAALPLLNKEARMIAISTANGENAFFEAYMKGVEGGRVIHSSRGLTIWENESSEITSIRLHYTAFAERDPQNADPEVAARAQAWLDRQRSKYLTQNDWDREMEINFKVSSGKRVYPTFSEVEHVLDPEQTERVSAYPVPMRRRKLLRAWDFGWHYPAVVVGQVDHRDRLVLYGELQGRDVDIERFAQQVIDYCQREFGDWSAWGYDDYCDPAGAQVRSIMSEQNETTELQVLARYGIHPTYAPRPRKTGRTIIQRLLEMRDDGSPALLVTRKCPTIIAGMLGGYAYKQRADGTFHEDPDDDSFYSHTQACLRYMVTNKFSNLAEARGRGPVMATASAPKFGANRRGGY